MKKILIVLLIILLININVVSAENLTSVCWLLKVDNNRYEKTCIRWWYYLYDKLEKKYLFYNNDKKLLLTLPYLDNVRIDTYVTIYNNYNNIKHIFIYVYPYDFMDYYCWYDCKVTDKEIREINQRYDSIAKKNIDIFWLYADWVKIFDYALSEEKSEYYSALDFFSQNWFIGYNWEWYWENSFFWEKYKTWIYLSEKIRKRLDRFIEKIDEKKYDKEKILGKLEVLYKKLKNWKTYKSRFYTEVIIYLYTEILLNKLKQQEKLEKIK